MAAIRHLPCAPSGARRFAPSATSPVVCATEGAQGGGQWLGGEA